MNARALLAKARKLPRYFRRRLSRAVTGGDGQAASHGPFVPPLWLEAKRRRLQERLACPACLGPLRPAARNLACDRCRVTYPVIDGAVLFLARAADRVDRTDQMTRTNPYSQRSLEIIRRAGERGGLVLDFGAGFPADHELFEHVVCQDVLHLPSTDVVSTTPRLPFPDGMFQAVVSESVFEHVANPFESARELCRVLAYGGELHVQTAFLQVYHRDPDHFFNMSLAALERLFDGLEKIESGVDPHQRASYAIRGILATYREFVHDRPTRAAIDAILALPLDRRDLDITQEQHVTVGAGVFFHGRKPTRGRA